MPVSGLLKDTFRRVAGQAVPFRGARENTEHVVRRKRIRFGRQFRVEKIGAETYASHILFVNRFVNLPGAYLAGSEIHFQHLAEITTFWCCHDYTLPPSLLG